MRVQAFGFPRDMAWPLVAIMHEQVQPIPAGFRLVRRLSGGSEIMRIFTAFVLERSAINQFQPD